MRYLLALWAPLAFAADPAVRVLSEFQRVDPFGQVLPGDAAERPREVLSPSLARNSHSLWQVILSIPEGAGYSLFIGQNPDKAVEVTMYRPVFVKQGETWIPDGLQPLSLSESGLVEAVAPQVPGQKVVVLWMDLFAGKDALVRRTRLEVQLNVGERWIIYPMELRIHSPVIPALEGGLTPLAPLEAPASETAAAVLRAFTCGTPAGTAEEGPATVRSLIRRNARQDMALARALAAKTKPVLTHELLEASGLERKAWCEGAAPRNGRGAEWYLRIRDLTYRLARTDDISSIKPAPAAR